VLEILVLLVVITVCLTVALAHRLTVSFRRYKAKEDLSFSDHNTDVELLLFRMTLVSWLLTAIWVIIVTISMA